MKEKREEGGKGANPANSKDSCIISERMCSRSRPSPSSPTKRNEKRTRRVAAAAAVALKWERVEDTGAWTNGGHDKGSEVGGGAKDKGRRSDPAES